LPSRTAADDTVISELTHSILAGVSQIESIVTDLLDYARETTLDCQAYRLAEIVKPAIDAYADRIREAGIPLVARGLGPDIVVLADGQRLRRVFVNVIENALDAAVHRPGALVEVALYRREDDAVVEISDNGEGIAPEARAKILLPFFTTKPTGTGLGLVIAKKIMDLHGGKIEIDTAPGVGTSVRLVIPIQRTDSGTTDAAHLPNP